MLLSRWIDADEAVLIHRIQIRQTGGSPGIRDWPGLDSAVARPQNRFLYSENVDAADLAAEYLFGIARNHPFIDGNKPTAWVVSATYLADNDRDVRASTEEIVSFVLSVASGTMDIDEAARWYRARITRRRSR